VQVVCELSLMSMISLTCLIDVSDGSAVPFAV
jgi:hypothetical protein